MAVPGTATSAFHVNQATCPRGKPQVARANPATTRFGAPPPALTLRSLCLLPRHLGPHIACGRRRRRVPGQDFVGDRRNGTLLPRPVPVWKRACCDAECERLAGLVDRVSAEMGDHALNRGLVLVHSPRHAIFRSKGGAAVPDDLQGIVPVGREDAQALGIGPLAGPLVAVVLSVACERERPVTASLYRNGV